MVLNISSLLLFLLTLLLYCSTASPLHTLNCTLTSPHSTRCTNITLALNSTARHALFFHCKDSEAITAWFDGCQVYFSCQNESLHAESNKNLTSLVSRQRLCHGETPYKVAGRVGSVTAKECEICLGEAVHKLYQCRASCNEGGGGSDVFTYNYSASGKRVNLQQKVIWAWCTGVACFMGVVVGSWLLRRKIVNTARVANSVVGSNGDF